MKSKLVQEILKRSKAQNIEEARKEWKVIKLWYQKEPWECICWQKNINKIWIIRNKETWEECSIWNNCIDNFLNQDFKQFFKDIKKIIVDITKAVSESTLNYCIKEWFVYNNNTSFYKTYAKIRNIENKPYQLEQRKQINREILAKCHRDYRKK